jgi:hypothetical protein
MMRDEREEYGEEARHLIEGLRRLARRAETPPDLAPTILARGEQLLPPQRQRRTRWWTAVAAWRPHPLAWGPVVAGAFFIAGVLTAWPRADMPLKDAVTAEQSAPVAPQLPAGPTEIPPASPPTPSQSLRQEFRRQIEPVPPHSDPPRALARGAPRQVSSSSHIKITASLPAGLYEQLQQEAERRQVSMAAILLEAVETYAQSQKRKE